MSRAEDIRRYKQLLDDGVVTQEEFDDIKSKLLAAPEQYGAEQENTEERQASGKSKIAAGLLAIFLGGLGVHKFYLGYTTEGVIMLVVNIFATLATLPIGGVGCALIGVIAFIEGILYLTKTDEGFQSTYVLNHKGWF